MIWKSTGSKQILEELHKTRTFLCRLLLIWVNCVCSGGAGLATRRCGFWRSRKEERKWGRWSRGSETTTHVQCPVSPVSHMITNTGTQHPSGRVWQTDKSLLSDQGSTVWCIYVHVCVLQWVHSVPAPVRTTTRTGVWGPSMTLITSCSVSLPPDSWSTLTST